MAARQSEQSWLNKLRALIEQQTGGIVIIEGEAGIGKSRLLTELSDLLRTRGFTELAGAGQSIEKQTPYRAWRDIFSAYFDLNRFDWSAASGKVPEAETLSRRRAQVRSRVQAIAPEQVERLPLLNDVLDLELPDSHLTGGLDPAMRQQGLVVLLVTLLRAWAKDQPLVLMLDDAHWLDSLSWELMIQVVRSLVTSGNPPLLVVTTRPTDTSTLEARQLAALRSLTKSTTISLAKLSPSETADLVSDRLGIPVGTLPEAVADLVCQRAEGNPLFAEEFTQALLERGLIQTEIVKEDGLDASVAENRPRRCRITGDLDQAKIAMTGTVQSLVLARIDSLPPELQLTLKVAAVIGRTFGYTPLLYALRPPDCHLGCCPSASAGPSAGFRFNSA